MADPATASRDQTACLFDLRHSKKLGSWQSGPRLDAIAIRSEDLFTSLQISRDGSRLVATTHPLDCCRVLNLSDHRSVWHRANWILAYVRFSRRLADSSSCLPLVGSLEVVDLETRETNHRTLPKPNILFLPDEDWLLVGKDDHTTLLNWRTNSVQDLLPGDLSSGN